MPRIKLEPDNQANRNLMAFLDMIAVSELGYALLAASDDGYNVLVYSTPGDVHTFNDYSRHPNITRTADIKGRPVASTAAGRYQQINKWFAGWTVGNKVYAGYKQILNLPDFGPVSQDKVALQLIKECHATDLIKAGHLSEAVDACSSRWASFPGNKDNQNQRSLNFLRQAFAKAGGEAVS